MLKPLTPLRRPFLGQKDIRKGSKKLFNQPAEGESKPIRGIESLIANPEPALLTPVTLATTTPAPPSLPLTQLFREPVPTEVESSEDDPVDYSSLFADDDHIDESFIAAAPEYQQEPKRQTPTVSSSPRDYIEGEPKEHSGTLTKENIVTTEPPEISTNPQLIGTSPIAATPSQGAYSKTLSDILKGNRKIKETKDNPSLDKIAERIFEKFKNHDDIPSYEDMWYDDNGDLLLSREETLGKNVKRQVDYSNIVRPVPLPSGLPPKNDIEALHQVTDTIDKFRVMLDLAQQVEYYISKRLIAGVNALSAFYEDEPPPPKRR